MFKVRNKIKGVIFIVGIVLSILLIKQNVVFADENQWVVGTGDITLDNPVTESTRSITGTVHGWRYGEGTWVALRVRGGLIISTARADQYGRFDLPIYGNKLVGTDTFQIRLSDQQESFNVGGNDYNIQGEVRIEDSSFFHSDTYHQIKVDSPLKVSKDMLTVRSSRYTSYPSTARYSLYINGQLMKVEPYVYLDENYCCDTFLYNSMEIAMFRINQLPITIKKGDMYEITKGDQYSSREDDEVYVKGFVRE